MAAFIVRTQGLDEGAALAAAKSMMSAAARMEGPA